MSVGDSLSLRLTEVEQQALGELVTQLQERLNGNLLDVTLFGSRARGTGGPDSDLDVLIVVERDDLTVRRTIRYVAADIWLACGAFISTRVWSRGRMERMNSQPTLFARNIQRDGISLLPTPTEKRSGQTSIEMSPRLPRFKTEEEIREFWASHDSTDYFDELEELPEGVTMLSPTRTVTLQVDEAVLDRLKKPATIRRASPARSMT